MGTALESKVRKRSLWKKKKKATTNQHPHDEFGHPQKSLPGKRQLDGVG